MVDDQDMRLSSPAALRNRAPILNVLRSVLPNEGMVLEVASGSGEHIVHFADALPALIWQPSDPSAQARASIASWLGEAPRPNVLAPVDLDAAEQTWSVDRADAVIVIKMVHISPWAATVGLFRGAGRLLPAGGPLFLYGPYRRGDEALAPGNVAFDESLRSRNPEWGIRHLDDVVGEAVRAGFGLERVIAMPANNLSVVLSRLP